VIQESRSRNPWPPQALRGVAVAHQALSDNVEPVHVTAASGTNAADIAPVQPGYDTAVSQFFEHPPASPGLIRKVQGLQLTDAGHLHFGQTLDNRHAALI